MRFDGEIVLYFQSVPVGSIRISVEAAKANNVLVVRSGRKTNVLRLDTCEQWLTNKRIYHAGRDGATET